MSRYRVRVSGVIDLDAIPGFDPLDERPASEQLEGITTALFLRHIDAWQHLSITIRERDEAIAALGVRLESLVTKKRGLGGWE